MKNESYPTGAGEKILNTAYDLFYRQGYHATGINQIISESGVAKATFYQHFPSKDNLWTAYAHKRHEDELEDFLRQVHAFNTPLQRFLAPLKILIPWFKGTQFRGCPFQNLLAEVTSPAHPVQIEARTHKDALRNLFKDLTSDLIHSNPKYAHLNPDTIAHTYQLIFEGTIATTVTYQALWPVDSAITAIKNIITKPQ